MVLEEALDTQTLHQEELEIIQTEDLILLDQILATLETQLEVKVLELIIK
jgi:hypothetical protein